MFNDIERYWHWYYYRISGIKLLEEWYPLLPLCVCRISFADLVGWCTFRKSELWLKCQGFCPICWDLWAFTGASNSHYDEVVVARVHLELHHRGWSTSSWGLCLRWCLRQWGWFCPCAPGGCARGEHFRHWGISWWQPLYCWTLGLLPRLMLQILREDLFWGKQTSKQAAHPFSHPWLSVPSREVLSRPQCCAASIWKLPM